MQVFKMHLFKSFYRGSCRLGLHEFDNPGDEGPHVLINAAIKLNLNSYFFLIRLLFRSLLPNESLIIKGTANEQ